MIEIPTIFYKRCIDSYGMDYNKLLNFCEGEKWGEDFEGTEYAFILNELQDSIIKIIGKAKSYESLDAAYLNSLGDKNYKCTKEDINKSKIMVLNDLGRKEICDYFMYYTIDDEIKKDESGIMCYMDLRKADRMTADVINKLFGELEYNMADYLYHMVDRYGWVDDRVQSKVFGVLNL